MIYIIYGLSGPLKRLLVDPIFKNFPAKTAKAMINVKATVRDKENYDSYEIVVKKRTEILTNYKKDYMYDLRTDTLCAVNHMQIDISKKIDLNHFIICHDFEVIKNIIRDYGTDNVKVFNISFNNQYAFVEFCENRYNNLSKTPIINRIKDRLEKLALSLNLKLLEGNLGIEPDEIRLIFPHDVSPAEREKILPNLLWEKMKDILVKDEKKYDWASLLNSRRLSNKNCSRVENGAIVIPFQNDYDLIVSSSPFRRLQDKAQVFPLEKQDYVRTRLTHSIECATIAEKVGMLAETVIQKKLSPNFYKVAQLKAIPTILKTAALLHDIGNPPFGHFGEDLIRAWITNKLPLLGINEEKGKVNATDESKANSLKHVLGANSSYYNDLLNYEGNAQGLRIISHLCVLDEKFGYDLTSAILGTTLKYPTSSKNVKKGKGIESKKVGYYSSEENIYYEVKKNLGLKDGKRHPLTFLLEAADDISYLTSDLQDAHKKGLISLVTIINELKEMNWLNDVDEEEKSGINELEAKKTIDFLITMIKNFDDNYKGYDIDKEPYIIERLHHLIKENLILRIIDVFEKNYESIMSAEYTTELLKGDYEAAFINLFIRERILKKYVYGDVNIIKSAVKASAIINCLLDTFVPACIEKALYEKKKTNEIDKCHVAFEKSNVASSRIYKLFSENYRLVFEKSLYNEDGTFETNQKIVYSAIMLALDNICGMTDSYAEEMYRLILATN